MLAWLRCFEAAARHGNFTRAAAELNLTQGAVSQQVRQLEDRLGCPLFHRLPRRLELTGQGRQLQAEITPALQRIEQAVSALRVKAGPLYVSCSPSFALRWLMPRLGNFLRRHPDVDVRLKAEFHALDRATFIRDGLDAAIRCDPENYSDIDAEVLMEEYLVPVASPAFAQAHEHITAAGLTTVKLLHDASPWDGAPEHAEWQIWLNALKEKTVNAEKGLHFNLADLAISAALAGEGVAMARSALVLDDIEAKRLVPLFKQIVQSPARYVLLCTSPNDPRVSLFASWLREEIEGFIGERQRALKHFDLT
jgi:DNA-binding transcriptional LysR family regulator